MSELDDFTMGFFVDLLRVFNGYDEVKENKRYEKLKSIEKLVEHRYLKGEISKQRYESYKKSLKTYEGG